MNRNRLLTVNAIFALMLFTLLGCKKDKEESVLTVDKTTVAAVDDAGEYSVKVTSNIRWITGSEAEWWCTVTPEEGSSNGEMKIKLTVNPSIHKRTTNVFISGNGVGSKTIAVTQDGLVPMLSIDKTTIAADKKAGTYTVKISSNVSWTIEYPWPSWCNISNTSGKGDETLTLTVPSDNNTDADRTAVFKVKPYYIDDYEITSVDMEPIIITITQSARTLTGMTITTPPTKTEYLIGELKSIADINLTGLVVTGTYDIGTSVPLNIKAENLSTSDNLAAAGVKTITVTVGEKTTTFTITVRTPILQRIEVTTPPTKTTYGIAELSTVAGINLDGLVVNEIYDVGPALPVVVTTTNLNTSDNLAVTGAKTITVTASGKTVPFTINVKTLRERITEPGRPATITMYADEEMAPTSISGSLTLTGSGSMRTIYLNAKGVLFTVGGTLTLGNNITLSGSRIAENNSALVSVNSRGHFVMKDGSVITENTAPSASGGGVYVARLGRFTMEGGLITENTANIAGGVFVFSSLSAQDAGIMTMSGGRISMNMSIASLAHDVYIFAYLDVPSKIYLSGDAVIGNLVLAATPPENGGAWTPINITGNFTGSVAVLDLYAHNYTAFTTDVDNAKAWWTGKQVLKPGEGISLTQSLINRFGTVSMRFAYRTGNTSYSNAPVTGYHIDVATGNLVAN